MNILDENKGAPTLPQETGILSACFRVALLEVSALETVLVVVQEKEDLSACHL